MTTSKLPPLPTSESFSSVLIKARSELGMTQSGLSQASGLSLSAIKGYETGRNMPGARELKALCEALHVSPNWLLFGTETPFEQSSLAATISQLPEDTHVRYGRLTGLFPLLAPDEFAAVYTLVTSLAVARIGEERVREVFLKVDFMVGMSRAMVSQGVAAQKTGSLPDPSTFSDDLESFMGRRGHIPKS